MVKLAEDPAFLADCETWTRMMAGTLSRMLRGSTAPTTAPPPTATGFALGRGFREDIMASAGKWGVRPTFMDRLVRLAVQVATGWHLWGLIPVFPWTSRQEVLSRLKDIQKVIGKTHKDFLSTLFRDELIRWIKAHCRHNGEPWTWPEVGAAVLGKIRLSFLRNSGLCVNTGAR